MNTLPTNKSKFIVKMCFQAQVLFLDLNFKLFIELHVHIFLKNAQSRVLSCNNFHQLDSIHLWTDTELIL